AYVERVLDPFVEHGVRAHLNADEIPRRSAGSRGRVPSWLWCGGGRQSDAGEKHRRNQRHKLFEEVAARSELRRVVHGSASVVARYAQGATRGTAPQRPVA